MNFYTKFVKLCNDNDLTPSRAATLIGFNKSTVSGWKNKGQMPTDANLQKIADFFSVPVSYFHVNQPEISVEKPTVQQDDEPKNTKTELIDIINSASDDEIESLLVMAKLFKKQRGK